MKYSPLLVYIFFYSSLDIDTKYDEHFLSIRCQSQYHWHRMTSICPISAINSGEKLDQEPGQI